MMSWLRSLLRPSGPTRRPDPLNPNSDLYDYARIEGPVEAPAEGGRAYAAILAHVEAHLGKAGGVLHEQRSDRVHIDIIAVPPSERCDSWTFVTSGMSDQPMKTPEDASDERFAELVIRLPADWPVPDIAGGDLSIWQDERFYWPVRMLKQFAVFPHRNRTWLGVGHTVNMASPERPAAPGVGFTAAIFLPSLSLPEAFNSLKLGSRTVRFLVVAPLYADEAHYKREAGLEDFFDLIADADFIEIINPERPSMVGLGGA